MQMSIAETRRWKGSEENKRMWFLREIHHRYLDASSSVRRLTRCGCPCSPLCLWLSLLAAIILLAALGTILVALLTGSRAKATTTEISKSAFLFSL
jgi:hypothetical protein